MELWVEDQKTKKCWKITQEEGTKLCQLEDISRYKFYPICPKEAPTMRLPEVKYEQLSIFDFGIKDET